jgi:hypothetical protein
LAIPIRTIKQPTHSASVTHDAAAASLLSAISWASNSMVTRFPSPPTAGTPEPPPIEPSIPRSHLLHHAPRKFHNGRFQNSWAAPKVKGDEHLIDLRQTFGEKTGAEGWRGRWARSHAMAMAAEIRAVLVAAGSGTCGYLHPAPRVTPCARALRSEAVNLS